MNTGALKIKVWTASRCVEMIQTLCHLHTLQGPPFDLHYMLDLRPVFPFDRSLELSLVRPLRPLVQALSSHSACANRGLFMMTIALSLSLLGAFQLPSLQHNKIEFIQT